jgi:putative ABC transport system permease protein
MRFADLLGLSLGALRQQKARTVMTTLGVVFGAFVLVISLSLGQGVQRTIDREARRNLHLRRVEVWPKWRGLETDPADEQAQVEGRMSDERRQRLRKALAERKLRYRPNPPRVVLDREHLQSLAAVEHVEAVTPLYQMYGWALLDGRAQSITTSSATPDNETFRKRLLAGEFFHTADEQALVVSELLCYLLGVRDDAGVQGLIGQKLRLEFRTEPRTSGLNVWLSKADGAEPTREEMIALEKVRRFLPAGLDHLPLEPQDKSALRKALQAPAQTATQVSSIELPIAGVLRLPSRDELSGPWDRLNTDADVLVPVKTAEELFFRLPSPPPRGVDFATLLVDRDENVKQVAQGVKDMGLMAHAPIEYIERERLIYLLIFTTMACVAGVALLIAALGIANTMLMSVLERTREIGIFKAVGAGDLHVQLIFLIEGACIGAIGGGLGLLLGWAASFPADAWMRSMISRDLKFDLKESLFAFPPWLTGGGVLFAVVVTTLAAAYPARRAARVNPLTALRHE